MEKKDKVTKAKGTAKTEAIIGTANAKFAQAVKSMNEGFAQLEGLEEKVQESVILVADYEDKIGGLQQDFVNKKAQQDIDLKLAFDSKREEFVQEYLDSKDLVTINGTELEELKNNVEANEEAQKRAISSAVDAATASLRKEHESDKKIATLEHEKKEASNAAEITQLKAQNKFLEDQLTSMRTLLNKQMEQETERAKHQAPIHINGTNQGR